MPSRGAPWRLGGHVDGKIIGNDIESTYRSLIEGGAGEPTDFLIADLSADQTTNISASDHVEFDTIIESQDITLSSIGGQLSGLIGNLKPNTVYQFEAGLTIGGSTNSAELRYKFIDNTLAQEIGQLSNAIMVSSNSNSSFQPICSAVHLTGGSITQVELQIIFNSSVNKIESDYSYLRVHELR